MNETEYLDLISRSVISISWNDSSGSAHAFHDDSGIRRICTNLHCVQENQGELDIAERVSAQIPVRNAESGVLAYREVPLEVYAVGESLAPAFEHTDFDNRNSGDVAFLRLARDASTFDRNTWAQLASLPIAKVPKRIGQEVYVYGFPDDGVDQPRMARELLDVRLTSLRGSEGIGTTFQVTDGIFFGMSGGGVAGKTRTGRGFFGMPTAIQYADASSRHGTQSISFGMVTSAEIIAKLSDRVERRLALEQTASTDAIQQLPLRIQPHRFGVWLTSADASTVREIQAATGNAHPLEGPLLVKSVNRLVTQQIENIQSRPRKGDVLQTFAIRSTDGSVLRQVPGSWDGYGMALMLVDSDDGEFVTARVARPLENGRYRECEIQLPMLKRSAYGRYILKEIGLSVTETTIATVSNSGERARSTPALRVEHDAIGFQKGDVITQIVGQLRSHSTQVRSGWDFFGSPTVRQSVLNGPSNAILPEVLVAVLDNPDVQRVYCDVIREGQPCQVEFDGKKLDEKIDRLWAPFFDEPNTP